MTYLKLLLVRHAQSLGNCQGQLEGQSSTALSAEGHRQAQCLTQALMTASRPTYLYSSPLLRAMQTAHYLTEALQPQDDFFKLQPDADLQEMHQGIFQGLTWTEAEAHYPGVCAQLMATLAWQPVPQAESITAARSRSQRWLDRVLSNHQPGDVIWTVSHEGLMQQLISVVMGCDRTWKIPIAHTAIFEFWLADTQWQRLTHDRYNPEYWRLHRFNDCTHLSDR
ncbi:histidine phosphatase family protein [Leptolyngbya sp. BC1307]|uniref:histidine phosphatase family protein n=1 Tax=Leptolyngbya sp. BC1307 TaxID=2029589 RepID=UPI000EFB55F8|nr:histidine phosphatase family protein [Leptolyngbya sp. BC1307]